LRNNATGDLNTAVGNGSLWTNTEGDLNTAVGNGSLRNNTTGNSNTAVGTNAGYSLTGNNNTFIGSYQGASWLSDTLSISTGQTERLRISADDTVDFNQKCGFTPDGGLWITDQRGDTIRTTFASNGFMSWEAYDPPRRQEPQMTPEEIDKANS
jgi:hypothetical protein